MLAVHGVQINAFFLESWILDPGFVYRSLAMSDKKESQVQSYEEKRRTERFAWLGPLLERRTTPVEPIEGEEDQGGELEEIKG